MRLENERLLQLAGAQDLDRQMLALHQSGIHQHLRRNRLRTGPALKAAEVDHGVFRPEGVGKSEFGKTPDQRHLATFEAGSLSAARAGQQTFVSLGGSFPMAGARPASDPLPALSGA